MIKTQVSANPAANPDVGSVNAAMQTLKAARKELETQIAGLNTEVAQISSRVIELEGMPVSFEDWSNYLRQWVDAKGKAWMDGRQIAHMCRNTRDKKAMNGKSWTELEEECQSEFFMDDRHPFDRGSTMEAMCFFMPEVVHSKLLEGLREQVGSRWGNDALPTVEVRKAEIAKLDEKRASLLKIRGAFESDLAQLKLVFMQEPESPAPLKGQE